MNITTTYTIQELLAKNSKNADLQKVNWNQKKDDVEFEVSSILGGDWVYSKKNNTIKRIS